MLSCDPKPRLPRSAPTAQDGWVWIAPTPGCRVARSVQLRPLSGNSRTVFAVTTALMSELASCTAGASVVTSTTVFAADPTCRVRLKTCCAPTVREIPFLASVANPFAETVT